MFGNTMVGSEAGHSEKRAAPRQRVFMVGRIVYDKHNTVVKCAVRDVSEGGAKLMCKEQASVPAEFSLVTMNDGQMREVRAKWRSGDLIGVEFISAPRNSPIRLH